MKIIFFPVFIVLPGGTAEPGAPVIGLLSVFGRLPDIIIPVRIFFFLPAFDKPGMFIGCMVYHQIQNYLNPPFMAFLQQQPEIFHRSEFIHNPLVIGNIIPVIMVWRLKYGRHPDYVNSQIRKVIQLFQNTSQVADSISVAVLEASGINLIHHSFFPPFLLLLHRLPPSIIFSSFCMFPLYVNDSFNLSQLLR